MTMYPYATGNLLVDRNTYFYTKYEGIPFLKAWKDDRDKIFNKLGGEALPPESNVTIEVEEVLNMISKGDVIETAVFLEALYGNLELTQNHVSFEATKLINLLTKKFELTKRVHKAYFQGFKAVDKQEFYDLKLFARAGEIFEAAYSKTDCVIYLNALLKCNDTLCAMADSLDSELKARLATLIARERSHVLRLADSVGAQI